MSSGHDGYRRGWPLGKPPASTLCDHASACASRTSAGGGLSRAIAIAGRPVRRSGSAASAVQTAHEQWGTVSRLGVRERKAVFSGRFSPLR